MADHRPAEQEGEPAAVLPGHRPGGPLARAFLMVCTGFAILAGIVLFAMMLHVCFDDGSRYVGVYWTGTTETIATYYMVPLVFLPIAYVTAFGLNIKVEVFAQGLSPSGRRILDVFGASLGRLVSIVWCWQSIKLAIHATRIDERTMIGDGFLLVWPSKWLLAIGTVLVVLAFLYRIVVNLRAGHEEAS